MVVPIFILVGMVLIVIQTSANLIYPLETFNPDLFYLLIAYIAFRFDLFRGLLILFPVSWMLDIVSGIFLGYYPFLCFGGYFFLKIAARQLPITTSYYRLPFVALSYLLVSWLLYLIISVVAPEALADGSWRQLLIRALLIMILAPPFFRFFETINSVVSNPDRGTGSRVFRLKKGNRYR